MFGIIARLYREHDPQFAGNMQIDVPSSTVNSQSVCSVPSQPSADIARCCWQMISSHCPWNWEVAGSVIPELYSEATPAGNHA
ncbi:MAG UNVERIFIED_CONTAM: hypothetical protein LVR18_48475 [Planctomycetaceae bacterium]|jgi:hypothetical protein